jgi:hypothetical protein
MQVIVTGRHHVGQLTLLTQKVDQQNRARLRLEPGDPHGFARNVHGAVADDGDRGPVIERATRVPVNPISQRHGTPSNTQ